MNGSNFFDLIRGSDLSPAVRVWSALAPALLVTAWFLFGLVVFAIRSALWGMPKDPETTTRGSSVLVGSYLRHCFFWLIRPMWRLVTSSGLPPNALTTSSVLLGLGSGAAAAAGRFALAGWLFIFSGVLDALDGRLARWRGQATPWGAAIDSTLDRLVDGAVLIGLAWYYRANWVLVPCLLALLGTGLVPYVRARGEALGVTVKEGLMQRVERIILLGAGMALSPVLEALVFPGVRHPMHWLAVVALVVLAATTYYTGLSRLNIVVLTLQNKAGMTATPPSVIKTRMTGIGMITALIAITIDFCMVLLLVGYTDVSPVLATAGGIALGAIANFTLNRAFAYHNHSIPRLNIGRYLLASVGSLALNTGGVSLLFSLPDMSFPLAWVLVRIAVLMFWNYPLHVEYIFASRPMTYVGKTTQAQM
jgi:phosphatidylglycerophosphate synthase/putative flippase GtrA